MLGDHDGRPTNEKEWCQYHLRKKGSAIANGHNSTIALIIKATLLQTSNSQPRAISWGTKDIADMFCGKTNVLDETDAISRASKWE